MVAPQAMSLNAEMMSQQVWDTINREGQHGLGPSTAVGVSWVNDPVLLLRPDLPHTLEELREALPGTEEHVLAGYRRRAWRRHVEQLFASADRETPRGLWPPEDDRRLYITQADTTQEITNQPVGLPGPPRPHPGANVTAATRRRVSTMRRRNWSPRPQPTLPPSWEDRLEDVVQRTGAMASSSAGHEDRGIDACSRTR